MKHLLYLLILVFIACGSGKEIVYVDEAEKEIVLLPSTIIFSDGEEITKQIGSKTYINMITGEGNGDISYSSENPEIATVDKQTGKVTLLTIGTTKIVAMKEATGTHKAITNSYSLEVIDNISPTIIFADGDNVTKIIGNPKYTNTISGNEEGVVTYTSENPEIATVDKQTGEVTILAKGTTKITAIKVDVNNYMAVIKSYSLTVLGIGSTYQGGKIAYILQSEDLGYDALTPHGIIVSTVDQSTGIVWAIPAFQKTDVPGTLTTIGSGKSNTEKIIVQNGTGTSYAAGIARAYTGGGYTDWYLPSKNELFKVYTNKSEIGFLVNTYWSSSEQEASWSWTTDFSAAQEWSESRRNKNTLMYVRAVRSF